MNAGAGLTLRLGMGAARPLTLESGLRSSYRSRINRPGKVTSREQQKEQHLFFFFFFFPLNYNTTLVIRQVFWLPQTLDILFLTTAATYVIIII
jgi:hypothetical protein